MADAATDPTAAALDDRTTAHVRARRERLRQAEDRLASAAAAPSPGRLDLWWAGVADAARELTALFADHVHETEGDQGLFREIEAVAPRLANDVAKLEADHRVIDEALASLTSTSEPASSDDVISARESILDVLSRLARHRFEGSDLLYQAYQVDIGASD